MALEW